MNPYAKLNTHSFGVELLNKHSKADNCLIQNSIKDASAFTQLLIKMTIRFDFKIINHCPCILPIHNLDNQRKRTFAD